MQIERKIAKWTLLVVLCLVFRTSVMAFGTTSNEYTDTSDAYTDKTESSDFFAPSTTTQEPIIAKDGDEHYSSFMPQAEEFSEYEDIDFETPHEGEHDEMDPLDFTQESYDHDSQEYTAYPEDEFDFNDQLETMYGNDSWQLEEDI